MILNQSNKIFDMSDQQLYKRIINHPGFTTLYSKVPTSSGLQKQFSYVYAHDQDFKLGQGSFGQVFVCFYQGQDRLIKLALKIIKIPERYDQIKTIEHIVSTSRQQIIALVKLRQNKHIIKIEDIVREKNMIYIMLEYCNQRDLVYFFTVKKKQEKITREIHIRYYFSQILDAFKELNKHNFMHRDIKPSNILVNNGVLKVADFGLSRKIFEGEETKLFLEQVGTMITAAPQIVFRQQYTNKCDIYSLGTILYWMIYDRYPFSKVPTRQDFTQNKLSFPQSSFPVSPELIKILKQMLAYKESDRIDWIPLLQHSLFDSVQFTEYQEKMKSYYEKVERLKLRETYGRNISRLLDDQLLDTTIPSAYYKFLREIEGEDKLKMFRSQQRKSLSKDIPLKSHIMIKNEYINQQIKLKLCRTIFLQLERIDTNSIKENKSETGFMKEILSLSLYKYMVFIMEKIKDQLTFQIPCTIFTINSLKQARNEPLHQNFINSIIEKIKGLQYMLKFEERKIKDLIKKCEEFHLDQDLGIIFEEINESNFKAFLTVIDQCIIEMVYFLKPQLNRNINNSLNISSNDAFAKNQRRIVVLIHYLFIFTMKDEIFPTKFDQDFQYDEFCEVDIQPKKYRIIQEKVFELLSRFQ